VSLVPVRDAACRHRRRVRLLGVFRLRREGAGKVSRRPSFVVDAVACPECGAEKGKRCQAESGRIVLTHVQRVDAYSRQEAESRGEGLANGPW
jgi:hypothetical protein